MKIIGLTGGIASGKSTVSAMLRKHNIPVIDADELARELTKKESSILKEIKQKFGPEVITDTGELDRQKLGRIVFKDKALLKTLEAILHPKIESLRSSLVNKYEQLGHQIVVYSAPLIFEKHLEKHLTKILLIIADINIVINRIKARDNLSNEEIEQRLKAQASNQEKINKADAILENNGSMAELYNNLVKVWFNLTGQELKTHLP